MDKSEKKELQEVGTRLAAIRKAHGLTQSDLSKQLNVSPKHISNVERGICSLTTRGLITFSEIFDCDLNYLLRGEEAYAEFSVLPKGIIDIIHSDAQQEKEKLKAYLECYLYIRK